MSTTPGRPAKGIRLCHNPPAVRIGLTERVKDEDVFTEDWPDSEDSDAFASCKTFHSRLVIHAATVRSIGDDKNDAPSWQIANILFSDQQDRFAPFLAFSRPSVSAFCMLARKSSRVAGSSSVVRTNSQS